MVVVVSVAVVMVTEEDEIVVVVFVAVVTVTVDVVHVSQSTGHTAVNMVSAVSHEAPPSTSAATLLQILGSSRPLHLPTVEVAVVELVVELQRPHLTGHAVMTACHRDFSVAQRRSAGSQMGSTHFTAESIVGHASSSS
jgi:hypothetical protein